MSRARDERDRTKSEELKRSEASKASGDGDFATAPLVSRAVQLNDDGSMRAITDAREAQCAADFIPSPPRVAHRDERHGVCLYHGNCFELLDALAGEYPEGRFDMIFADPPYFLSNGGITCQAGRMVRVDKGAWDKSRGPELNHEFNLEWLRRCQKVLKPNGTIWVSGTLHVIFSVGYALQQLGYKILNEITWEKPNPPPNLSCRYFTHSTETILWAAKKESSKHQFNYSRMREMNRGKQMKSVWRLGAPSSDEKTFGKHPTQKPIALVERCLLASTNEGDLVLDPFLGSGTTVVAALRTGRHCVGIEANAQYLDLSIMRVQAESQKPGDLFAAKPMASTSSRESVPLAPEQ